MSEEQKQKLQKQLWDIANTLRVKKDSLCIKQRG